MNTLVPEDDRPRARVLSKRVFEDVPTQAELDAMADKLSAVRKNRNGLAVFVVLLIGMLAASVAGLVVVGGGVLTNAGEQGGAETALTQERERLVTALQLGNVEAGRLDQAVSRVIAEKDAQINAFGEERRSLEARIADMQQRVDAYAYFDPIQTKRRQASVLREEIRQMLEGNWSQAPAQISSQEFRNAYEAYQTGLAWRERVEGDFDRYIAQLETAKRLILAWRPAQTAAELPRVAATRPIGEPEAGVSVASSQ